MFDVGLLELAVIALVAVIVLGPDRLPDLARQAAQLLHRARGLATTPATSSATSSARSTPTSSCATSTPARSCASTSPRRWPRSTASRRSRQEVRPPRGPGPALRRRGDLTLADAASVVAALHGDQAGVRHQEALARGGAPSRKSAPTRSTYASWRVPSARCTRQRAPASASRRSAARRPSRSTGDHATSGTERSLAPRTPTTERSGTIQSWPVALSRHQPSPTRSSRPSTRPTCGRSSATSCPREAIRRLASVTEPYSVRARSASSASRSASQAAAAWPSRSSNSANSSCSQDMGRA